MSLPENSSSENLTSPVTEESSSQSAELSGDEVDEQAESPLPVDETTEPIEPQSSDASDTPRDTPVASYATRDGIKDALTIGKSKMLLLGGGLLAAVLFFVFTAIVGRSSSHSSGKKQTPEPSRQSDGPAKGSVTPLMDSVQPQTQDDSNGQLTSEDIKRTRSPNGNPLVTKVIPPVVPPKGAASSSNNALSSVPSFSDTQQRWEEPRPYGEAASSTTPQAQKENDLKEPSLVFVRSQPQSSSDGPAKRSSEDESPFLEVTPGFRILAKLQTEISSADPTQVVAVVQYTYAIGDHEVVPAGALISGHLQQADRSGYVHVKFDEIQLIDKRTERIDAVGKALDMGPIKGIVTGKNTGKNLLIRSVSGVGSTLATVLGTNTGSAISEDDLIRQRLAENIGTAGDSEVMNLALNSHEVVSVPAETLIYIVFNKHDNSSTVARKGGATN